MELRNITTFLRVAELQNFTHAAQELGYSQSAVTVQIRQLEIELGVPLFERIGRSVNLTAPGQAFLQQAGEIIKAAERARDAVRTAPEPEGTLRLGTMESLGASVVWRLIAGFHRQFPRVNVVVRTSTADGLLEMMRRNDVDFIYFVDEKQYSPDWENPAVPSGGNRLCHRSSFPVGRPRRAHPPARAGHLSLCSHRGWRKLPHSL